MSGLRESVINYYFIAVFNFLLPVKAALYHGGFICISLSWDTITPALGTYFYIQFTFNDCYHSTVNDCYHSTVNDCYVWLLWEN